MSNQSDDKRFFCVDRVIPLALEREARAIALAENPANAPNQAASTAERLALVKAKMWKPGRTLRCRFLDGDGVVQQKVRQYAAQWTEHANIRFDFGDDPRAEIRIAFSPGSAWSACGTDCLVDRYYPAHQPTMNLGPLGEHTADGLFSRTVLHEFGHALGCIHEHQNPVDGIQWIERAVLHYFKGPPNYWDESQIRFEVLDRYNQSELNGTSFDPESIMCREFPKGLAYNFGAIPLNTELSAADIAFIKKAYPAQS